MIRRTHGAVIWAWAALGAAGCGGGGDGGSSATASSTRAPGAPAPAPAITRPEDEIARRFAPELRFNAYFDDGATSSQNRNEDFFPGSVDSFFASLAAGRMPMVLTQMSIGLTPSIIETIANPDPPSFGPDRLDGTPEQMAGATPGTAPTYVYVHDDPALRVAQPGGGEARRYYAEYWFWYPQDYACSRLILFVGCFGGHRGDWEHAVAEVDAMIAPSGALAAATLTAGHFAGHDRTVRLAAGDLDTVDDQERAGGEHMVVYVSMGKHAAYPEPGELHDFATSAAVSDYDDFFRGNGVWTDSWMAPLIEISPAARAADPARFAPPGFVALHPPCSTWLDWQGMWGPDDSGVNTPFGAFTWASSPEGPWQHGEFGLPYTGSEDYAAWKGRQTSFVSYKDLGRVVPRAAPVPFPVVR